jgi:hypothetical protein
MKTWKASDTNGAKYLGELEIESKGEFYPFSMLMTDSRIVFGGACNAGFLESGFIVREENETLDETLRELIADLEVYYNDGAKYVSRIVCNKRM